MADYRRISLKLKNKFGSFANELKQMFWYTELYISINLSFL